MEVWLPFGRLAVLLRSCAGDYTKQPMAASHRVRAWRWYLSDKDGGAPRRRTRHICAGRAPLTGRPGAARRGETGWTPPPTDMHDGSPGVLLTGGFSFFVLHVQPGDGLVYRIEDRGPFSSPEAISRDAHAWRNS